LAILSKLPNIYHITPAQNLASIIQHGGLWSDLQCQNHNVQGKQIGYSHIKQRRMRFVVPLAPGGSLGDYVPFYFAPRSPMLFTISRGNVPEYQEGQQPVVHLVSSVEDVNAFVPPVRWLYTDGHAVIDLSNYYDDLANLHEIDWDIMGQRYWADTLEDGDRERRRQAEFLVHQFFPWRLVSQIGVMTQGVAEQVQGILADAEHKPDIAVKREWYY
jgi:hypothetical protein